MFWWKLSKTTSGENFQLRRDFWNQSALQGIRVCYPDPFGKPRAWCALIRLWSNSQQPFDVELRRNECQTLAEVQGIWGSLFENPSRNLTVLLPQCVQEHSMFKYGSALPFRNYHGIHKLTESIVAVRQHTLHFQTKYSPFIARSEVCIKPNLLYQTGQKICLEILWAGFRAESLPRSDKFEWFKCLMHLRYLSTKPLKPAATLAPLFQPKEYQLMPAFASQTLMLLHVWKLKPSSAFICIERPTTTFRKATKESFLDANGSLGWERRGCPIGNSKFHSSRTHPMPNHFFSGCLMKGGIYTLPGSFWETKGLMCLDLVKFTTAFWCWTSAKRVPNARRGSRHLGVSVWKSIAQPHRAPTTMCARTQHVQIWISAPFSQLSWHSQAHWKHCRGEATHTAFPNQIFSFHRKKRSLPRPSINDTFICVSILFCSCCGFSLVCKKLLFCRKNARGGSFLPHCQLDLLQFLNLRLFALFCGYLRLFWANFRSN